MTDPETLTTPGGVTLRRGYMEDGPPFFEAEFGVIHVYLNPYMGGERWDGCAADASIDEIDGLPLPEALAWIDARLAETLAALLGPQDETDLALGRAYRTWADWHDAPADKVGAEVGRDLWRATQAALARAREVARG